MKHLFIFLLCAGALLTGCKKENDDPKIPIEISSVVQNVSIYGASDGAITLSVTGGKPDFTFNWSNGATTKDISELSVGTYKVTVTDLNGDTATHTATVTEPTELAVSYEKKDESAVGNANGKITLSISGGTPPYAVLWNSSDTTQVLENLTAGTYSATVTDKNGASKQVEVEIYAPLKLTLSATNVTTMGGSNGSVDLLVEGGVAPFTLAWSNGSNQEDLSGLEAGYYEVTVTSADTKTKKAGTTVYEPYIKATTESNIIAHVDRLIQAGMRIEYEGKVIYIDPINVYPGKTADADIILITHNHGDHFNWGVIGQLVKGNTSILVTSDIFLSYTSLGTNTIIRVAHDSVNEVSGIKIEAVYAYNSNHNSSVSVGYILNLGTTRFYHSGDTKLIPEMSTYNVDIACLPMGQNYTFASINEAVEAAEAVGASVVIPMHYGNAEGFEKDPWTFMELANGAFDVVVKPVNQ